MVYAGNLIIIVLHSQQSTPLGLHPRWSILIKSTPTALVKISLAKVFPFLHSQSFSYSNTGCSYETQIT